jgi:Immunity protein 8
MIPQLRRIDTNSAASVDELCSRSPNRFGFWINASIGSDQTDGADDFQIFVCDQAWLDDKNMMGGGGVDRYLLVEGGCERERLVDSLNGYLAQCAGNNWSEVVAKISKIGIWEFAGYQP